MKKISARINNESFFEEHFRSISGGCEYVLESFPTLYTRTLHELRGKFLESELSLIVDVFNSTMLMPHIAGQHLIMQCVDGMKLDGLDDKWGINKDEFLSKLHQLSLMECVCLEIWAKGFWHFEGQNIDEYVKVLL